MEMNEFSKLKKDKDIKKDLNLTYEDVLNLLKNYDEEETNKNEE